MISTITHNQNFAVLHHSTFLKTLFLCGLLWMGSMPFAHAQIDTLAIQHPAEGITYVSLNDTSQPWRIHLVEVDLQNTSAGIHSEKAIADGDPQTPTRQTLPQMWTHLQGNHKEPVAAINADFFNMGTGDPINIQVSDSEPAYVPHSPPKRSQFGVTGKDAPFIDILNFSGSIIADQLQLTVNGINNMPSEDGLTFINRKPDLRLEKLDSLFITGLIPISEKQDLYVLDQQQSLTPPMIIGSGAMKDSLLMLQITVDTLHTQFQFFNDSKSDNKPIEELVGGAVQLLEDGEQVIDRQLGIEGVGQAFASDRHPRTAVGISDDKHLYMIVVDGRQDKSVGMSLYELADFMAKYDITEGINLDGGGSTTMMVDGKIVNSPSDKTGARTISNALFIIE